MTEARANEILRTKYPEATITKGQYYGGSCSGRIVVVFQPGGKAYQYHGCSTYQQILERLGFKILYKHNVEGYKCRIKKLEDQIAAGGYENIFVFPGEDKWHTYSEEEINQMRAELGSLKNELATAIID